MTRRYATCVKAGAVAAAMLFLGFASAGASAQAKGGADIYLDKCAVCHGADGAAKSARGRKLKMKDVRETVDKVTAEQMAEIVAKGKPPDMDGYAKELTADQIKEVVGHYRGLAKK